MWKSWRLLLGGKGRKRGRAAAGGPVTGFRDNTEIVWCWSGGRRGEARRVGSGYSVRAELLP